MFLKKILPFCACCLWLHPALADNPAASGMVLGPLGLNTIPSARMDPAGTVRLGVSTLDPYVNAFLGFQLSDSFYFQLRQTAEISSLNESDRLYPGVDVKIRLVKESATHPDISLGLQSVIGHKRMAGEYLAATKRYRNFDFTGGIGWGRYAGDWFAGDNIGVFAGVEYDIPKINGLSVKLDWGQDRYKAEQHAFNFEPPPPWSVGLAYKPLSWIDMSIAAMGTDKIMARLSLTPSLQKWKHPEAAPNDASNMHLYDRATAAHIAQEKLEINPYRSAPEQFGQAAIYMANHAERDIEGLEITPTILGLRGPTVRLLRKDFEQALVRHQGSSEEIWRHASFYASPEGVIPAGVEACTAGRNEERGSGKTKRGAEGAAHIMPDPRSALGCASLAGDDTFMGIFRKSYFKKLKRPAEVRQSWHDMRLVLDQQLSLSEEDSGILTRTSIVAGRRKVGIFGFLDTGYALRLNLFNNLGQLSELRPPVLLPVRSNVDKFADRIVALDEFYAAFTHSFRPDLHLSLLGGYLEEMYGGFGGELLYRPFGKRYAFGVEAWEALKREPAAPMDMGFNGDHLLTGHVNAWYDIPEADLMLNAKIGRYLAEDFGGTLSLQKRFKSGAYLEGYITVTNQADFDEFGGTTHAMDGVRLVLPLGGRKYIPDGGMIRVRAEPFGRNTGQTLENPMPLYEVTEPFSYGHMIKTWDEILPEKK